MSPVASVWVSGFGRPGARRSDERATTAQPKPSLGRGGRDASLCSHHKQNPDNPDNPTRKRPDRFGARLGLGWVSGFPSVGPSGLAGLVWVGWVASPTVLGAQLGVKAKPKMPKACTSAIRVDLLKPGPIYT